MAANELRYDKQTEEFLQEWDDDGTDSMLQKYEKEDIENLSKLEPMGSHQEIWLKKLAELWPSMQEGRRLVHDELIYDLDTDAAWNSPHYSDNDRKEDQEEDELSDDFEE